MKLIIVIILAIILYCLGSALFYMVGRRGDARKMAVALTWRISLSIALFIFLFIAYQLGWVHPHPLILGPVKENSNGNIRG